MDQSTKKKHKKAGTQLQQVDKHSSLILNEKDKLNYWKEKYEDSLNAYKPQINKIDELYGVYEGSGAIYNAQGVKSNTGTSSVRKVAFELIEAQADVTIPMPKVTSLAGNEDRAQTVEHYIMNEIDRLPFEEIADEHARAVPITGSGFFLVEWDNSVRTHNTVGKLKVSNLDANSVIPQKGKTKIDDMDYIFVRLLESKASIINRYGIDLPKAEMLSQTETDMDDTHNDELVTHIYCYYKDKGEISLISWVDNTIINDLENYFARKEYRCTKCDRAVEKDTEKCECGCNKFKLVDVVDETVEIPALVEQKILGIPTGKFIRRTKKIKVPYYVPRVFPIIKRTNVSKRNSFLGSSDVEKIADQQNDLNITMAKIKEKLLKGGSIVTIGENTNFEANNEELKIIRVKSPAEADMINARPIQPNIATDMEILETNYNIARQTIGITDSFQGRYDPSATSGKAKLISSENAAGRLKSKQEMKNAAYSDLYRVMFYFMLAYADEPRTLYYQNEYGQTVYKMFDKRMFIDKDESGNYFYDDEMIFDTDESSTLANNRQLMWQETHNNFQSGAYGDPTDAATLVMYWQMMNSLHYPGAKQALEFASQRLQEQRAAQEQQAQNQAQALQMQNDTAYANSKSKLKQADAAMIKTNMDALNQLNGNSMASKETLNENNSEKTE